METTSPKPFVFVLMPFAKEFDDVYNSGIKPACIDAGAYPERVDEQIHDIDIVIQILPYLLGILRVITLLL